MVVYVSGGSGSGKSEFAESLITSSPVSRRIYLAAMRVWDAEGERRVERHRALRAGKGFETVEYHRAEPLDTSGAAVLLEDLTNLFMNEFYDCEDGAVSRTESALRSLAGQSELLVIVGNDIGSGGDTLTEETERLTASLSELCRTAAGMADECYEVCCGIAVRREKAAPELRGLTLLIGGAGQGAEEFASGIFGSNVAYTPREARDAGALLSLEEWLRSERDPMPELERLIEQNPNVVITCREVGCGVVPVDASEREQRERTGRVCCALAARAETVVRFWCGIPVVLKGGRK